MIFSIISTLISRNSSLNYTANERILTLQLDWEFLVLTSGSQTVVFKPVSLVLPLALHCINFLGPQPRLCTELEMLRMSSSNLFQPVLWEIMIKDRVLLLREVIEKTWLLVDLWVGLGHPEAPHPFSCSWNMGSPCVSCSKRCSEDIALRKWCGIKNLHGIRD